jgi:uncharacterized Zn finger protein
MSLIKSREPAELEKSAETEVEGEIREFVRRDVATLRRQQPEADSEMVASNISSLLQRVAGTSVQEIDKLISELQTLREMLHSEGARVQRDRRIRDAEPSGDAVDQDHRREPDTLEEGPGRAEHPRLSFRPF